MPTIREFARLTTDVVAGSMDQATIPEPAFRWLAENALRGPNRDELLRMDGPRSLRALNHVGLIETPCGTRIEILPKHTLGKGDVSTARALLVKMIGEALDLRPRTAGTADVTRFTLPLPEWLASLFLEEMTVLARRGLRRAYRRIDSREPFLRGALDVSAQIRRGPAGAHLFSFRHDEFSFDRPENRLIRSAVQLILRSTRSNDNWRLARELSILLDEIPESADLKTDLRLWSRDRLMADYSRVATLCELILTRQSPLSVAGPDRGLSLLFPMERLFEAYVTASLRAIAPSDLDVRAQTSGAHLCAHKGTGWFRLRPDVIVSRGDTRWIIDAKWKLLNGDRAKGYGLAQADFYQMHAYGQRYLGGKGDLHLVYPRTSAFDKPLAHFDFGDGLRLLVIPFDLDARTADYSFLPRESAIHGQVSMHEPHEII